MKNTICHTFRPVPYRYDPEAIWVFLQYGASSTEFYLHASDSLEEAESAIGQIELHSYDCETAQPIERSPLESVAPLLVELLESYLNDDPVDGKRDANARRLLHYAKTTKHFDDIVVSTRQWWHKNTRNHNKY